MTEPVIEAGNPSSYGILDHKPRGLVVMGLCLSLLLPALLVAVIWHERDRENASSAERAEIIAQAVQRQLDERLARLAEQLQRIAQDGPKFAIPDSANPPPPSVAPALSVPDRLRDIVLVREGHTVDLQGRALDAPWLPPRDPEVGPSGLSIGAPMRDAANARWLVPLAWDGQPGSRVGARIDADWFADMLMDYPLGEDGILNVLHRDRVLVARSLANQHYVGRRLDLSPIFDAAHRLQPSGSFAEASLLDGIQRQFLFRRVPHTPLIVVVGSARRPTLIAWARFAVIALAGGVLLGGLWFWMSHAYARGHARQNQLLREVREQYRRAQEARRVAGLGEWTWNLETGEVTWSEEIFLMYGLEPHARTMQVDEIPDRFHPDDRERVHAQIQRVFAGGEPGEEVFRIVRPDGEVRTVYSNSAWIDGPGRHLRGIQQDVTELAQTRERLLEAQGEYRFMFDFNPLPLCVYDRETLGILAVNDAMIRQYGYTREEMLAANVLDIRPQEDVAIARSLLLGPSSEYPQGRVWTHLHKDGRRMRMAAFGHEIDFDGRPARLIVLHDVTEREAAEQRFQLVARATSDAIWDWDLLTNALWWSDGFYTLFGYTREQVTPNLDSWETRIHPDDLERVLAGIHAAIASDASEWEDTYRFLRHDGSYADVLDRGFFLRDAHGRAVRGVGGMLDITRKREAEADLRLLRRAVEATQSGILIADVGQPHMPAVYVNPGFEQMTGYSSAEILGQDARVLGFDERDVEQVWAIRRGLREHSELRVLLRNRRKDGSLFWNDFYMAPIRDDSGVVTHMVSVSTDVTERQRSEERFQMVARVSSDTIWDWDMHTGEIWRSDNVYPLTGFARDEIEIMGGGWTGLLHPDDRERAVESLRRAIESDATDWECSYRIQRNDGQYAEVLDRGFVMRDENGRAIRAVGGMVDVTQKHRDEADLRLLRRAVESADNGILIADAREPHLPAVYFNRAFEKMTGYASEEILGSSFHFLREHGDSQSEVEAIRQAIAEQREVRVLLRDRRKDGQPFWNEFYLAPVRDEVGVLTHFVSIQSDVSERQRILEQLAYQATFDELTGLPNRQLLTDRLQQAVHNAERHQRGVGVLFVDLDDFKLINDSLGHSAGDEALRTVAQRLATAVRGSDTVGRFGGDEFIAILTEQVDDDGVGRVIARITAALASPVEIFGVPHYVTASIGYCSYPAAGHDAETLLKHADLAMYQAKQQGRNRAVAYRAEFDIGISERLHMVSALRDALQRDEFRLEFQPLFGRDGAAVGMEALLRWQHPERGLLAPGHFIGLCEDSGLIVPIGRWVLHEAARHHVMLSAQNLGHLRIAVNVSAVQFQTGLYDDVHSAVTAHGLLPGALEVELTESAIMANPEAAIEIMQRLEALGVSISVDDFGTGYSSLAYLKRLPIDRLKIDRSFVDQLGEDEEDDAICIAIITLAHSLGLYTVAEGVETTQQMGWLHARGCDEMQGFLLGRPLPFDAALAAIKNAAESLAAQ